MKVVGSKVMPLEFGGIQPPLAIWVVSLSRIVPSVCWPAMPTPTSAIRVLRSGIFGGPHLCLPHKVTKTRRLDFLNSLLRQIQIPPRTVSQTQNVSARRRTVATFSRM
jgi:hypothetical protein